MPGGSEGPNWILLAGGAAVTALSYLIRRRQKNEFEDTEEDGERKSGKAQRANYDDGFEPDYWGIETPEACPHQDSVESVASSSLTNSMRSGLPIAPALSRGTSAGLADALLANNPRDSKQSPPSVEFTEEEKRFQRRVSLSHEDVRHSNQQGVQIGRTAKRDMVHRLRKQLKSRDEMILRMQVQISENERSSSLSDAHVSELQSRLEATSGVLSNLDLEIQLFRNQLANFVKFASRTEDCRESTAGGAESAITCGGERRDIKLTLLEFTKLREVLDRLKMETTAREIERQALLQEYNSMVEKVGHLECALKEQTTLVSEKEQALNKTQEELLRLTSRLQVQDMNLTLLELTKLREALDRLKMETTAREIERQALLQEYNSMVEKVDHLECVLKEQTTLVSEKEQALNETQEELLRLTSRLQVQDTNLTLMELTKLKEALDRLKMETTAREIERQALLQEYNSMVEKVDHLECALKEQTTLVSVKEQALNKTQEELLRLTSRLQVQIEEMEPCRLFKAKLETCIYNLSSSGLGLRDLHNIEEIISSTSTEISDSSSHLPQGQEDPELIHTGHEFKTDFPENIKDPAVFDSVVAALQLEVEQLTAALAPKSKVTGQKEQTTRFAKDLQVEGTMDTMLLILDSVPGTLKFKDSEWLHLSQQLSSATSLATPAHPDVLKDSSASLTSISLLRAVNEVNELNINSIEVAKCKRVEDEMADIRKYDAKISELRRNSSNLTQDSIDEVRNEQSLHVAALICGLAEKIAAQEEQAKQTALEVQQLSTSFQLLTPIVAKLQDKNADLPLMAQPNPAEMVSYDVIHMKFNSSSVLTKHAAQGSNTSWAGTLGHGRQDSDASDSSTLSRNQISPDYMLREMVDDDYHFRVGASGPLSIKSRKFSSKWDGKNGRRKKSFTHDYGSGSDADILSSGNWASKSEGDKDLYRQNHVNADVPQYLQHSLGSFVEFQDLESRSIPVEEEKNGHNAWAVQQKDRYVPLEVDQVMAAGTPDADFVPTFEEYSPHVRQVRSPRQGIESSRRYLFNAGNNRDDHANSLEASTATAAESSLEEESASVRSFLVERFEASSISPLSRMMTQLDSTIELPETSSLQDASVELLLPDSPQDVVEDESQSFKEGNSSSMDWSIVTSGTDEYEANSSTTNRLIVSEDVDVSEANAPVADMLIVTQDTNDSVSESGSEERGSIDSEFEEMLDGTLDDLVKIFSTTVTPASTPRSSVLSQNSESKKFQ